MSTTVTPTKTARSLVAAGTSNAAGATTRATLDLRTKFGGTLTIRMINGATGPTVACSCNVLQAHNDGATPAAASKGSDWKTIATFSNGTAANTDSEWSMEITNVQHLEVEFTGNTGQAVTVEAQFTEFTNVIQVTA